MRVLLDNNIPVALERSLARLHNVLHCRDLGWEREANGRLVRLAASRFDAMLTADKKMPHQTSLAGLDLAVLVLDVRDNRVEHIFEFVSAIRDALPTAPPGAYTWVRKPDPAP